MGAPIFVKCIHLFEPRSISSCSSVPLDMLSTHALTRYPTIYRRWVVIWISRFPSNSDNVESTTDHRGEDSNFVYGCFMIHFQLERLNDVLRIRARILSHIDFFVRSFLAYFTNDRAIPVTAQIAHATMNVQNTHEIRLDFM